LIEVASETVPDGPLEVVTLGAFEAVIEGTSDTVTDGMLEAVSLGTAGTAGYDEGVTLGEKRFSFFVGDAASEYTCCIA